MLDVAIKYKDILKIKMCDTWFNEKYKYWNYDVYYHDFEVKDESWNGHEFVSVKDGKVIGYIAYKINRTRNYCEGLSIVNLTDDKLTFGVDLEQAIDDIFNKFTFHKLKFSVIVGNPIENSCDKIINKFGGRIVGIEKKDIRLIDGRLYDIKLYEIIKSDYLKSVLNRKLKSFF